MIIDCHNHPDWHGHNLDKFIANMRQYHIDKTWLLSWECPPDDHKPNKAMPEPGLGGPIPFARCLSYVERAPDKFILGHAVDPKRRDAFDRMEALISIYGVRVYGELKLRITYDDPDALRMFRFCGEKKLPVVAHIDYEVPSSSDYPRPSYWYGGGIEAFERALQACPQTNFLGHAPGFWAHISDDGKHTTEHYPKGKVLPDSKLIVMMRKYSNLYCDISGTSGHNALSRDLNFCRDFLSEFQDRILYGRDYFDNRHQEFLNSLDLSREISSKIYSSNALKLTP